MGRYFGWIVCMLLAIPASFAASDVGKATEVSGKVMVAHEGGKSGALKQGDAVLLKDTIETKKDGAVKIDLKDKSSLVLREDTKIIISEFVFNPEKNQRETGVNMAFGKLKAVIQKVYNKSNSKTEIKAPTAVVGVRGTEFAMDVSKKKSSVYCLKGNVETFNPLYPQNAVAVGAGKFTNVLANKIPEPVIPIPKEVLNEIESRFGFPTSVDSLKERGMDKLRSRLPFP